jgi:hypothetical protein
LYANNLNKGEDALASLHKIGTILYEDTGDESDKSAAENFLLTPISIPIDWLVVVGAYLSLSIAVIGVKAKQSVAVTSTVTPTPAVDLPAASFPTSQLTTPSYQNYDISASSNSHLYPLSQPSMLQTHIPPPNLRILNTIPLLPTPNSMSSMSQLTVNTSASLTAMASRHLKEQLSMPPPQIIPNQQQQQQISPPKHHLQQQQQQQQHHSQPPQYQNQSKIYSQTTNFRSHPYSRPTPPPYQNRNFFNHINSNLTANNKSLNESNSEASILEKNDTDDKESSTG